jgi:hypothetical protein
MKQVKIIEALCFLTLEIKVNKELENWSSEDIELQFSTFVDSVGVVGYVCIIIIKDCR